MAHASDCAVHNAPALPVGPCDCGENHRLAIKAALMILKVPNWHDTATLLEAGEVVARAFIAQESLDDVSSDRPET